MTETSVERAANELAVYQELKRKICREAGGPEDCMPMLVMTFADGQMALAGLGAGHPTDQIVMAAVMLRSEMEPEHGRVIHLLMATEGYMRSAPVADADDVAAAAAQVAREYPRGALSRQFLTEVNTEVREGLIVSVLSPTLGTTAMVRCAYVYDDHGHPVFDAPEVDSSVIGGDLGGAVLDEMERAVR